MSSLPSGTHREDGVQPQQIAFTLLQGEEQAQQFALYEETLGRKGEGCPQSEPGSRNKSSTMRPYRDNATEQNL